MDINRMRFILAMVITAGYVILIAIVTIAVVATDFERENGIAIIAEVSKVMAGFIGMIVGYYFSRSGNGG